jgi:hypothetical protein
MIAITTRSSIRVKCFFIIIILYVVSSINQKQCGPGVRCVEAASSTGGKRQSRGHVGFAACDIDVLCSISESFPYSILEGIREGCAVITSDVGGMSRLIDSGENGYIFQPKDVDTFAKYILELSLDADKRQRFASALYEKSLCPVLFGQHGRDPEPHL